MDNIFRIITPQIEALIKRNKSVLLFGARQTGKTTLLNSLQPDVMVSFVLPEVRQRYEKHPDRLIQEITAKVSRKKITFHS